MLVGNSSVAAFAWLGFLETDGGDDECG